MSKLTREEQVRRNLIMIRVILAILAIGSVAAIARSYNLRHRGTPVDFMDSVYEKLCFDADTELPGAIEENYLRYLNKAYVLIGKYPDCEYYKISKNVKRNTYNWAEDFYVGEGKLYYNYYKDGKAKGKVAIDVSEHQKTIDWEAVGNTEIEIAILRVGYRGYGTGAIKEDEMFETNYEGAKKAKMQIGVYFFSAAINREEGIEEAKFCLKKVKGKKIKQPIIIDTEYVAEDETARSNNISVEDRTAAVVGFCETVEAAGYTPMIYASRDHFVKYLDVDKIGKWEFWLAAYDTPVFPYHTEGYQYSPYGYVDGIPKQVDLDVWMR